MTNITKNTNLLFSEIKRGHAAGKTYECTAGRFIEIVKQKDHDGMLDIGVEPIFNDGHEWSEDKFWELSIKKQLEMCCENEGNRYAANITYTIVES